MRAVLFALLLAGCGTSAVGPNPWDERMYGIWPIPEACWVDLSKKVTVPVIVVPKAEMIRRHGMRGTGYVRGQYFPPPDERIEISDAISGREYASVLHHERCHAVVGHFHP